MTISAFANPVPYSGDDSTTTFAFSFPVSEPDTGEAHDLEVTLIDAAGAETTLTEGTGTTDYSVSVPTYPGGGTVTYPASGGDTLATGESLVIRRKHATLDQPTDIKNQGAYLPEVLETQLDEIVQQIQQLQEEIDRCLQIKVGDKVVNSADPDLPVLVADEFLRINATGDGVTLSGASTTTANASSATPQDVTSGGGSAGVSTDYSRADHVHDIGTAADVVSDTTPQLGGTLDANGQNILIDSTNFIGDEAGNEQIIFSTTASAINELTIANAAAGNGPTISSTGDETDIDINITPKGAGACNINGPIVFTGTLEAGGNIDVNGFSIVSKAAGDILITPDTTGDIILDGQKWPQADGNAGQVITTDGAGQLAWQDNIGEVVTQSTTDATVTTVWTKAIPSDSAMMVHVEGIAVNTDDYSECMGFELHNAVLNDGGTSSNGTAVKDLIDIITLPWDVTITANDTTDEVEVKVTGQAAKNINWKLNIYFEAVS